MKKNSYTPLSISFILIWSTMRQLDNIIILLLLV